MTCTTIKNSKKKKKRGLAFLEGMHVARLSAEFWSNIINAP